MLADAGIDPIDVTGAIYAGARYFKAPSPKGDRAACSATERLWQPRAGSVAQRLNDPEFANAVMEKEGFEYITLTRAFHADPHMCAS